MNRQGRKERKDFLKFLSDLRVLSGFNKGINNEQN